MQAWINCVLIVNDYIIIIIIILIVLIQYFNVC